MNFSVTVYNTTTGNEDFIMDELDAKDLEKCLSNLPNQYPQPENFESCLADVILFEGGMWAFDDTYTIMVRSE